MRRKRSSLLGTATLLGIWFCTATAEEVFNHEVGISFAQDRFESTIQFDTASPGVVGRNSLRIDSDVAGVAATWFYSGVMDGDGPLHRAAFIDRASSVSFVYSRGDRNSTSTVGVDLPSIPSFTTSIEQQTDEYDLDIKHVWKESGWLLGAGVSRLELKASGESLNQRFSSSGFSLGFGKYLGDKTAAGVRFSQTEGPDDDISNVAFVLNHIGQLGARWNYGVDIVLRDRIDDDSDGNFDFVVSVYPSRVLSVAVDARRSIRNTSDNLLIFGLSVSWFPGSRTQLSARYFQGDVDAPEDGDVDTNGFGLFLKHRF